MHRMQDLKPVVKKWVHRYSASLRSGLAQQEGQKRQTAASMRSNLLQLVYLLITTRSMQACPSKCPSQLLQKRSWSWSCFLMWTPRILEVAS